MSSLQICYICGGSGTRQNRLIVCAGTTFVRTIHAGIVSGVDESGKTSLAPIMTKTGKNSRLELCKCTTAPSGRAFHPGCLGRDPAGANAKKLYTSNKDKTQFSHCDQTHNLCEDCLSEWQAEGGKAGKLAETGGRAKLV
jgi:hypothetical protein